METSEVRGMTVVYLDRVWLMNTAVDYLLLLATAHLSGLPLRRVRLGLCACAGGLYAAAVFLPGLSLLAHPICRAAAGVMIALAAFRGSGRQTALFFLLSGAFAGVVLALCGEAAGYPALLLAAGGIYAALRLLFGQAARHGGGELLHITIVINGRRKTVTALRDTGSTLRDPVSGRAALVLERRAAEDLWPREMAQVLALPLPPEEKMARLYRCGCPLRVTLLPFRAVGTEGGLLLAVRSDYIEVEGKRFERTPVALSEQSLSDGGGYHALWGGEEADHAQGDVHTPVGVASQDRQAG